MSPIKFFLRLLRPSIFRYTALLLYRVPNPPLHRMRVRVLPVSALILFGGTTAKQKSRESLYPDAFHGYTYHVRTYRESYFNRRYFRYSIYEYPPLPLIAPRLFALQRREEVTMAIHRHSEECRMLGELSAMGISQRVKIILIDWPAERSSGINLWATSSLTRAHASTGNRNGRTIVQRHEHRRLCTQSISRIEFAESD